MFGCAGSCDVLHEIDGKLTVLFIGRKKTDVSVSKRFNEIGTMPTKEYGFLPGAKNTKIPERLRIEG